MAYLVAAVASVGALTFLNLLLILVVVRRMRQDGRQSVHAEHPHSPPVLPVGTQAPEFTTVTVSGERYSLENLLGARSLVGLFTPRCTVCRAQLPEFAELARMIAGGRSRVLVVVAADDLAEGRAFGTDLEEVASVVVEPRNEGPVHTAFSMKASPTFYLIDGGGRIEASDVAVRPLTMSVAVAAAQ